MSHSTLTDLATLAVAKLPLAQDLHENESRRLPLEVEQRVSLCHEVLQGSEKIDYPLALKKRAFEILRYGFDAGDLKTNSIPCYEAAVVRRMEQPW